MTAAGVAGVAVRGVRVGWPLGMVGGWMVRDAKVWEIQSRLQTGTDSRAQRLGGEGGGGWVREW